ncbi:MAG: outer membrane beta-barrel protein [Blastocatellia bacterium]|nr:outer membrane beta-barrel protein [Blastocatellia bacterium]
MLKYSVRTLIVTILLSLPTALAQAQSTDTPKFEVGGQFTYIRLRDIPVPAGFPGSGANDPGVGVRVGYNLTNSIAAEAEFNYFPRSLSGTVSTVTGFQVISGTPVTYSNSRTQGLFGVKYLFLKGDTFGIGAKVRPGFVHFVGNSAGISGTGVVADQIANGYSTFAMDFGGVFEYYPIRHIVARMDLGDTIIRIKGFDPNLSVNGFTSSNLQLTIGFGFRF